MEKSEVEQQRFKKVDLFIADNLLNQIDFYMTWRVGNEAHSMHVQCHVCFDP